MIKKIVTKIIFTFLNKSGWGERYLRTRSRFHKFAAPGHYYSPLPRDEDAEMVTDWMPGTDAAQVRAIHIDHDEMIKCFQKWAAEYGWPNFPDQKDGSCRYYFKNGFFSNGDGWSLYAIMRSYRPRRIIEVGSGFSSAMMLEVNDAFLNGDVSLTFIEPYPERLRGLLKEKDEGRCRILECPVQSVGLENFQALEANDVLFIDSSHVVKYGSDVIYLLTEVVPSLKPGVLVHIHDIQWPFEYPREWLREGRAWNETYLVKAFLQFNEAFEVLIFNSYLGIHACSLISNVLPKWLSNPGGSLWLRKK